MKTSNQIVFAYILGCIDPEAYEVKAETDKEKLQFLADTFKREYWFPENQRYYGSVQNGLKNWIMGLPSSFNVDFENHRILELAREWGTIQDGAKGRLLAAIEDRILGNWFNFIASKTLQLMRKHTVTI